MLNIKIITYRLLIKKIDVIICDKAKFQFIIYVSFLCFYLFIAQQ